MDLALLNIVIAKHTRGMRCSCSAVTTALILSRPKTAACNDSPTLSKASFAMCFLILRPVRIAVCTACTVSVLVVTFQNAIAEDVSKPVVRQDALTENQVIRFFCDYANLADRGIARSPFQKSVDEWVFESLVQSKSLKTALSVSEDQIDSLLSACRLNKDKAVNRNGYEETVEPSTISRAFESTLTAEQLRDLSLLYLKLEGFMAVRRTEFRDLIGVTIEDQNRIDAILKKYADRARALHGTIFTLPNNQFEMLPKLNLELRALSAKLDREIADSLSDSQRLLLAETIIKAAAPKYLIETPAEEFSLSVLANRPVRQMESATAPPKND